MPLWTNRYDGPANGDEAATGLVVDRNGNVIVTGVSPGAGTHSDVATIKYSNDGVPLWTNRYDGFGNWDDGANAIAVDANGTIFVTGSSALTNSPPLSLYYIRWLTIAYSPTGVPLWTNWYGGTGKGSDNAVAMAVDTNGNVFVTGYATNIGTGYDFVTVAYSTSGTPLWTNLYNGPYNGGDRASAIAVGRNGDLFVTGWTTTTSNRQDIATIAYSTSGTALWTNRYPALLTSVYPPHLAVDSGDNVIVAGTAYTALIDPHYGDSYVIIKYSGAGVPLWTNSYSSLSLNNQVFAVAVDADDKVIVTGWAEATGSDPFYPQRGNFCTIAWSSAGVPMWTNEFGGASASSIDVPLGMALDSHGNIYVTGRGDVPATHCATVAYSNAGLPLWTNVYVDAFGGYGSAIALDRSGNVFVAGTSDESASVNRDYVAIKYASLIQPIPLALQMLNNQAVLSWTNSTFSLQTAPTLSDAFTNVPGAQSPYTNPASSGKQFFRLISN